MKLHSDDRTMLVNIDPPRPLLSTVLAVRLEQLKHLRAHRLISRKQFRQLLDAVPNITSQETA